jgi:hypothetical protein
MIELRRLPTLGAEDRHRHREAADNQHYRVYRAEFDVEVIAGCGESFPILVAKQRVRQKHATEEHYFGDEKYPHTERTRFALLLHVREMVLQRRMRGVFVSCC